MTPASDWVQALAAVCEKTSQAAAARKLGISTASISLLLRGNYKAETSSLEAKVRAGLMAETRGCPVLGEISLTRCMKEQAAPYFPSPIRSDLYRACRTCPHKTSKENR